MRIGVLAGWALYCCALAVAMPARGELVRDPLTGIEIPQSLAGLPLTGTSAPGEAGSGLVASYGADSGITATVRFYDDGRPDLEDGVDNALARGEFAALCRELRARHDSVEELDLSVTVFEMHWRETEFFHGHFSLTDAGPAAGATSVNSHIYLTAYRGAFVEVRYTVADGVADPSGPNPLVRGLMAQMLARDLDPRWSSEQEFRRSESTVIAVTDWLEAEPGFPPDEVQRVAAAFAMEWLERAPYLALQIDPGPLGDALQESDCELEPLLLVMHVLGTGRHALEQGAADLVPDNVAGIECALRTSAKLALGADARRGCEVLDALRAQAEQGALARYYRER